MKGDAQFRLFWSERPDKPVPTSRSGRATHAPALRAPTVAGLVERGREVLEHRCIWCHTSEGAGLPEFAMSGPDFKAMGSRTHRSWLTKWILDPKAQRPVTMPQLLHGDTAKDDAADIAAYLSTLRYNPPKPEDSSLIPSRRQLHVSSTAPVAIPCRAIGEEGNLTGACEREI